MWMTLSFTYQSSFSRNTALDLHSPTSLSGCSRGKHHLFVTVLCSLPARDVVIDFGKYKGCKLGTLPSRYLQWLIRESHQSSLTVWGDYAKQVLQDPHYKDRLEWQSIEKLGSCGKMRKDSPLAASAGVKGSMNALGWDLSDRNAWSKVNFSLLGTTEGGRIPRKQLDPLSSTLQSDSTKPKPKTKTALSKPAMKTNMSTSLGSTLSRSGLNGPFSSLKATGTNTIANSKLTNMNGSVPEPQHSKSLTLQEELLRRRKLRRERSASKSSYTLPPATDNVQNLFLGRDSLLKRVRKREDT